MNGCKGCGRRVTSAGKAFTLIELLVTVGIIALLAAIAVPNLLEAQVRSKVARVKNDLRVLDEALAMFHTDNRKYPEVIPPPEEIELGGGWLMKPLTTPVAYISSLPSDPFTPAREPEPLMPPEGRRTYHYTSYPIPPDPAQVWAVKSNGPDLVCDTWGLYKGYSPGLFYGQDPELEDWALYDPTNGTMSRGDIFRGNDFIMQ